MQLKIGLEVHIQLDTATKLFCPCPTSAAQPNSSVCEICLGHPGAKPSLNSSALRSAIALALATNCNLSPNLIFSRKTYFYPDLPKNFQITQYETPIGSSGVLEFDGKKIGIARIQLEEDPGTLKHGENFVLIDYNRSGIPLIELVTQPELGSPEDAIKALKALIGILKYLKIYSPRCQIRTDANISCEAAGWARVEIKNVLGIKELERALSYEAKRQQSHVVVRETRGWDAELGLTYSLRPKEFEEDYGYITEPDLPELEIRELAEQLKAEIPELPAQKAKRFAAQYPISQLDAEILASEPGLADLFERLASKFKPKFVANWLRHRLLGALHRAGIEFEGCAAKPEQLEQLLELIAQGKLTPLVAKRLLEELVVKPFWPAEAAKARGLLIELDISRLRAVCSSVIKANPEAVQDYKAGKAKALNWLIGKVAAEFGKAVPPNAIREVLLELLEGRKV